MYLDKWAWSIEAANDVTEQCYGLGLCTYYSICCIDNNAQKQENNSECDIIQIIFKWCESEMYLIVLLPNHEHTYDHIDHIEKEIRAL